MISANSLFKNREEAGLLLAEELGKLSGLEDALVLALPRGGVPVAFEVARVLEASLDILVVRKLGVPGQEELAFGAVGPGGVQVFNDRIVEQLTLPQPAIDRVVERERAEIDRRELLYRGDRPPPEVTGRTVVVVDDGVATGSTMRAAVEILRKRKAGRIIVAVPTAPPDTVEDPSKAADAVVAVMTPAPFSSVGQWYRDFTQVSDIEVRHYLEVDEMDSSH